MTAKPLAYLCSPYSHECRSVRVSRYNLAVIAAAQIVETGHAWVFSPIVHSHPLCEQTEGIGGAWGDWEDFDRRMLAASDELWVLALSGWEESVGVAAEMKIAREYGKPVHLIQPGDAEPCGEIGP